MTDTSQFRNFTTRYDPGMGLDLICDALNLGLYIGVDAASDASPTISSAIIKFIQSGSSAIARTMQAKGRDRWDIRDYCQVDGTTDDSTKLTALIAQISTAGGGTIHGAGTCRLDSTVTLKDGVNFDFDGLDALTFDYRGTNQPFVANEAVLRTRYTGFTISLVNNSNTNVDAMVFNYGATRCYFDFYLLSKNAAGRNGLVIYGTQTDDGTTANNNQYGNTVNIKTATNDTEVSGVACYFKGAAVSNARCNNNIISNGAVLDGFSTALKVQEGNGNVIGSFTCNAASVAAIHIYGDSITTDNIIAGPYLDASISGAKIKLESTAASAHYMATIAKAVNVSLPTDITLAGSNSTNIAFGLNGTTWGLNASSGLIGAVGPAGDTLNGDGKFLQSISTYAGGVNAVSNSGGASAVIGTGSAAQFRVVKTSDGASYTIVGYMDINGAWKMAGPQINTSATVSQSSGALDLSAVTAGYITVTALSANITTITMPTAVDGKEISIQFRQAASGGPYTVAFPASVHLAGGSYTMSTSASKIDMLTFKYSGTVSLWIEQSRSQNM